MVYSFDVEMAIKYGQEEAIMIENFTWWISKNKANGKHGIEFSQDYYSIKGYQNFKKIQLTFSEAQKYGREAARLSKDLNIEVRKVPDESFGWVGSYKRFFHCRTVNNAIYF